MQVTRRFAWSVVPKRSVLLRFGEHWASSGRFPGLREMHRSLPAAAAYFSDLPAPQSSVVSQGVMSSVGCRSADAASKGRVGRPGSGVWGITRGDWQLIGSRDTAVQMVLLKEGTNKSISKID